ncbi:MAG: fluoride efflux transporter FluC [Promethearchaeota archaeon]
MSIVNIAMVGLGGFFGAVFRGSISTHLNSKSKHQFPWGTLTVNLLACAILAIILPLLKTSNILNSLFITGFIASLSTFSTYMLEHRKISRLNKKIGWIYLISSIMLGLLIFEGISLLFY